MTEDQVHNNYMKLALQLARGGLGYASPNPLVGAVLVKNRKIIGCGYHAVAGYPHAEVMALQNARDNGADPQGAQMYVNLEPCSHYGRTGPCADAVIAAGITKVYAGMTDPNPRVAGQGIAKLRSAGIEVQIGLLQRQAELLNERFVRFITTGRPFVLLKCAVTLDGKTACDGGDSRWITGEQSRRFVHCLRAGYDAVLTGIGTILNDDPQFTVRMGVRGRCPAVVVADSLAQTPLTAEILKPVTAISEISIDNHFADEMYSNWQIGNGSAGEWSAASEADPFVRQAAENEALLQYSGANANKAALQYSGNAANPDSNELPIQWRGLEEARMQAEVRAKAARLPLGRRVIIAVGAAAQQAKIEQLEQKGAEVWCFPGQQIDLRLLMARLAEQRIASIMVEAGQRLNGSLLGAGLVDRVNWFVAPKIIGDQNAYGAASGLNIKKMTQAVQLKRISYSNFGNDIMISGCLY